MIRFVAFTLLGLLWHDAYRVGAIPQFDINLDIQPQLRWTAVARYYREELVAMTSAVSPVIDKALGSQRQVFLQYGYFDPEYEAELQGIVNTVQHPNVSLDTLKVSNMLYEMQSPTACSAVLWAMANGTVLHGRNMDYSFHFKMPNGKKMNWPEVTFQATMYKGGKPLFVQVQWPGGIGVSTAMRFSTGKKDGWSFQQNTRMRANEWHENLVAAQKGGQVHSLAVRKIMETTPDYKTAVQRLYSAVFMAPQYFIVAGTGPYEGAVLTIDRLGQHQPSTPPIQRIGPGAWHLVQTNDDLLSAPGDDRRPLANQLLQITQQSQASQDYLMQFMHTSMLFNDVTVYSTVMVPSTGYFKTVLPSEPPLPIDGDEQIEAHEFAEQQTQFAAQQAQLMSQQASQLAAYQGLGTFGSQQGFGTPPGGGGLRGLARNWASFLAGKGKLKHEDFPGRPRVKRTQRSGKFLASLQDELSFMQTYLKLEV